MLLTLAVRTAPEAAARWSNRAGPPHTTLYPSGISFTDATLSWEQGTKGARGAPKAHRRRRLSGQAFRSDPYCKARSRWGLSSLGSSSLDPFSDESRAYATTGSKTDASH